MGDLTANISRYEIACRDGCGYDSIDWEVVQVVQDACDHFSLLCRKKVVLIVTSGCRCMSHNNDSGSSFVSQHLTSRAIDHKIKGIPAIKLAEYYLNKYPGKYGIGVYSDFIHIDTRTAGPARWEG